MVLQCKCKKVKLTTLQFKFIKLKMFTIKINIDSYQNSKMADVKIYLRREYNDSRLLETASCPSTVRP